MTHRERRMGDPGVASRPRGRPPPAGKWLPPQALETRHDSPQRRMGDPGSAASISRIEGGHDSRFPEPLSGTPRPRTTLLGLVPPGGHRRIRGQLLRRRQRRGVLVACHLPGAGVAGRHLASVNAGAGAGLLKLLFQLIPRGTEERFGRSLRPEISARAGCLLATLFDLGGFGREMMEGPGRLPAAVGPAVPETTQRRDSACVIAAVPAVGSSVLIVFGRHIERSIWRRPPTY